MRPFFFVHPFHCAKTATMGISVMFWRVAFVLAAMMGQASAQLEQLAEDPRWLKLLQYEDRGWRGGWQSAIVDDDFFLAPHDNRTPLTELVATLDGLPGPLGPDPNSHTLCRYPARAIWLDEQLGLGLPDPFAVCPELAEWSQDGSVEGVSVLFVAGYFSNPGSAFGHILLRLHTGEGSVDVEDVLDTAINYGAADSEEDPLIPYIVRGLTGHYRSTYSTLDFFHHSERFREQQLRDVWQYRLALAPDDVRLLTAHIWELLRAHNRYYFLRQNCAYRVAKALELVVDQDLTPGNKLWMAPVDAFTALTAQAGAAVADVKRLASRETEFADGYRYLPQADQNFVDRVVDEPMTPLATLLEETPPQTPGPALDVALDYFAFAENIPAGREAEALALRFQMPAASPTDRPEPQPPHKGQASSLWQVRANINEELGVGAEFRVRPAYFDFLSNTEGTTPYSELSMGDLRVIVRDGEVHLKQLEVVRVTALGLQTGGVPNRDGWAFRFRTGAETKDLSCDDCLLGYVEAGLGEAVELAPGLAAYGLLSARLEAGDQTNSVLSGVGTAGLIYRRGLAAIAVEGGFQQGVDEDDFTRPFGKAELRLGPGVRWDVRFQAEQREVLEWGVAITGYW